MAMMLMMLIIEIWWRGEIARAHVGGQMGRGSTLWGSVDGCREGRGRSKCGISRCSSGDVRGRRTSIFPSWCVRGCVLRCVQWSCGWLAVRCVALRCQWGGDAWLAGWVLRRAGGWWKAGRPMSAHAAPTRGDSAGRWWLGEAMR